MGKLASIKKTGRAYQATVYERSSDGRARPIVQVNGPLEVVTRWDELSSRHQTPVGPKRGTRSGRAPAPRPLRLAPKS